MLIRTQDRNGLIVFENVLTIYEEYNAGFYDVAALLPLNEDPFNDDEPPVWWLGKYSTKEKAIKVLDMIQYFYCQTSQIQGDVFQMPQDEKVNI